MVSKTQIVPFEKESHGYEGNSNENNKWKCKFAGHKFETRSELEKSMWPLLYSMRICGLVHTRDATRKCLTLSQVYAGCILALNAVSFLRVIAVVDISTGFTAETLAFILLILWNFLSFMNTVTCFLASHKPNALDGFFENLVRLQKSKPIPSSGLTSARYKVIAIVLIAWSTIIINVLFVVYILFFTNSYDHLLWPMPPSHPQLNALKGVSVITLFYVTVAWVFPVALFASLCSIILIEMAYFNESFDKIVESEAESLTMIEVYSKRHHVICKLIARSDDTLSLYNATSFVTNTILTCVILYNIITGTSDYANNFSVLVADIFWLGTAVLQLAVLSIAGGMVNHMVSKCIVVSLLIFCI